jgi:hypothetical protein
MPRVSELMSQNISNAMTNVKTWGNIVINVKNYSSLVRGIDWQPAIQAAINYAESIGGGTIYFPSDTTYYLATKNTEYNCNLVIKGSGIEFASNSEFALLQCETDGVSSVIYAPNRIDRLKMTNIRVNANNKADYAFNSADYVPYSTFYCCRFESGKVAAFSFQTFVCTIRKTIFASSPTGLRVTGGSSISTAITLDSCYALDNTDYGYDLGLITYSNLISCAVDNMPNGIAYNISGRGVTLTACGAERVRKAIRFVSFRGVQINTFFGYALGSADSGNPTDYLFEFVSGLNATVSGLWLDQLRSFRYKLGVSSANYGFENVTVLDDSVARSEIYQVSNFKFNRPIRLLRGDASTKDETINLTVNQLNDYLNSLADYEINHTITIKLADGVQPDLSTPNRLTRIKGSGKLLIQGNASNRSAVRLHGGADRFFIESCDCSIELKDLTLENRVSSAFSNILQINNSSKITLNNVAFSSNVNTGAAVLATNGSNVLLANNTGTTGTGTFAVGGNFATYDKDESSDIRIADGALAPTTGFWTSGMKIFNPSPQPGGYVGVICTASGKPGTWKGFGLIES